MHAEVRNLAQVTKIDPSLAAKVTKALSDCARRYGAVYVALQRGRVIAVFGVGHLAPTAALEAAVEMELVLSGRAGELYGHAVLVSADDNPDPGRAPAPARIAGMRNSLDRANAVLAGGVYCDERSAPLLATAGAWGRRGELWRLERLTTAPVDAGPVPDDWFWCRQADLERILDSVHERLNTGSGHGTVVVAGRDRSAVRRYVEQASRQLVGANSAQVTPRLGVVRGWRSPSHPFLNCLSGSPLESVGEYLDGPEARTWAELAPVIKTLTERGSEHYPDRAFHELVMGTQLYLLAQARRSGAQHLPAPIQCLDMDRYHPVARRALVRILRDLLQLPQTIVLVTVGGPHPPELQVLAPRRVTIRPLTRSATSTLLKTKFPGAIMPDRALDQLLRLTSGGLRSAQLCLRYLVARGKLQHAGNRWRWVPRRELPGALPASPDGAAWRVARELDLRQQEALLAVQLGGGLLQTSQLARLLVIFGHPVDQVSARFDRLAAIGLIDLWPQAVPAFPRLTAGLETALGARAAELSRQLYELTIILWRSGALSNHLLVFVYLSRRAESAAVAAEVLYAAAQRCIEEATVAPATALFPAVHLDRVRGWLQPEEAAALDYFVALVRAQIQALQADSDEVAAPLLRTATAPTDELEAFALSTGARLHLRFGATESALADAKEALSWQQRPLCRGPEAPLPEEAYVDLSAAMLATGKISESLGYLRFARLANQPRRRPYLVRAAALNAVAAFLSARLDEASARATAGRQLAASHARRDWEAFFWFLAGRARFAVGDYQQSIAAFESALAVCEVYGLHTAAVVARHWHARAHAFAGSAPLAAILLSQASSQPHELAESLPLVAERALFQAEARYLAGDTTGAVAVLDDTAKAATESSSRQRRAARFPAEVPTWSSGFFAVEGWCHRLGAEVTGRLVRTFRAFLVAELGGRSGPRVSGETSWKSVEQLGHEQHIRLDPSLVAYHAWYAQISLAAGPEQQDNHALVIGRGVAHLRERAGRILSPGDRTAYLEREHWNAALAREARRLRLF